MPFKNIDNNKTYKSFILIIYFNRCAGQVGTKNKGKTAHFTKTYKLYFYQGGIF